MTAKNMGPSVSCKATGELISVINDGSIAKMKPTDGSEGWWYFKSFEIMRKYQEEHTEEQLQLPNI